MIFLFFSFFKAMPDLFPLKSNLPANLTYETVVNKFRRFKPLQSGFSLNLLNSSLFSFDPKSADDPKKVAEHIDRIFTEASFLCPGILKRTKKNIIFSS